MMAKIQKCDGMIWNISIMKLTDGCQSTQGETGPKVICPSQIQLNWLGIKHVSPLGGAGN